MNEYVVVLITWSLAILVWSPIGLWTLQKLQIKLNNRVRHFIVATIIGASLYSTFLGVASLVIPITAEITLTFACFCIVFLRNVFWIAVTDVIADLRRWPILNKFCLVAFVAMTMLVSAHTSLNNDSGLYYLQFIEWINTHRVVPGLANLHDRLGFNSHWHLLIAAFNYPRFGYHTNDLNGVLFILIGLGSFDSASRILKDSSLNNLIWVVFPIPFFLLLRFLTSASPDLPSTLIPFVYFALILEKDGEKYLALLTTLLAFAITVKVVSVLYAIAMIPMVIRTVTDGKWNRLFESVLLGMLILLPWLGRNVVQTGYLIFPFETIDLFQFDWKVPKELAGNARKAVQAHAQFGNCDLINYGKPITDWFRVWLNAQSKTVLVMLFFSTVICIYELAMKFISIASKRLKLNENGTFFLALSGITSLTFWWFSGPNPRFIYGVVFFFIAFGLTRLIKKLNIHRFFLYTPIIIVLSLAIVTSKILIEPGPVRPTSFGVMGNKNGIIYFPSSSNKCWDHNIPCSDGDKNSLQFRGKSLGDGFKNSELHN